MARRVTASLSNTLRDLYNRGNSLVGGRSAYEILLDKIEEEKQQKKDDMWYSLESVKLKEELEKERKESITSILSTATKTRDKEDHHVAKLKVKFGNNIFLNPNSDDRTNIFTLILDWYDIEEEVIQTVQGTTTVYIITALLEDTTNLVTWVPTSFTVSTDSLTLSIHYGKMLNQLNGQSVLMEYPNLLSVELIDASTPNNPEEIPRIMRDVVPIHTSLSECQLDDPDLPQMSFTNLIPHINVPKVEKVPDHRGKKRKEPFGGSAGGSPSYNQSHIFFIF